MERVNSLPNDKILDGSNLKALADNKIKVLKIWNFILERVENIVEMEKLLVTSIIFFFPQCFQKGTSKVGIAW